MKQRIKVLVTMPELEDSPEFLSAIAELAEVEYRICRTSAETAAALKDIEVLYTQAVPAHLEHANKLKWVQMHFSGIDHARFSPIFDEERGIALTNVAGAHAVSIAEYCVYMMGILVRNLLELFRDQQAKRWDRMKYPPYELCGRTVGIVGYGHVGGELGRLARALNMRVLALKRNPHQHQASGYQWKGVGDLAGVFPERFFGPTELAELLKESDFVVNCLPHTPQTSGLFSEPQFKTMKAGSYFINVGRGETVDYPALVRVLKDGHIAGAALDSFATDPHPLDKDDALWELPNVLISPHISGTRYSRQYLERTNELFCENLRRYLNNQSLLNTVRGDRGY